MTSNDQQLFTRLETCNRLRKIAAAMRTAVEAPGAKVTIELRTHPHATKKQPKRNDALVARKNAKLDEYAGSISIQEGSKRDDVKAIGAVLYLQASKTRGHDLDVLADWVVWLGTDASPATVVRKDGQWVKEVTS